VPATSLLSYCFLFGRLANENDAAKTNPLLCLKVNLPLRAETDIMTGREFMATSLCN
jgi:hypothetical protein